MSNKLQEAIAAIKSGDKMTGGQIVILAGMAFVDIAVLVIGLLAVSCTPAPSTAETSRPLSQDVFIELTVDLTNKNLPLLIGKTNLPDGTVIMTSVDNHKYVDDYFLDQDRVTVENGSFRSRPFGPEDGLPDGKYRASITMPVPDVQPASVREVIGNDGENLSGPLVKRGGTGVTVELEQEFQIGSRIPTRVPTTIPGSQSECDEFREWSVPTTENMVTAVALLNDLKSALQDENRLDVDELYHISNQFYAVAAKQADLKPQTTRLRMLNSSLHDALALYAEAISDLAAAVEYENADYAEDAKRKLDTVTTDYPALVSQVEQIAQQCGIAIDQ